MTRKYILFYFILIFSFIILCNGFSEEAGEVVSVPRQLSLFLVFKGNFEEDEIVLLKETLLIKLAEDNDISLVEPLITLDLTQDAQHSKAGELGADCLLAVTVTAKTETIEIVYSSYDLINKEFIIEEKKYEKSRIIRSLHRSFWKDIVLDIGEKYNQITGKLEVKEVVEYTTDEKDAIIQKGVKVVIEANPGTRIHGLTHEILVVNERGIAKVELSQLTTYRMKALCTGYYPVEKNFYVEYEPIKITLEQEPGSRIAFDVYLHQADYLGAGFLFYIKPNFLFLELSATTYIKKLIWPVEGDSSDWEAPLFPIYFTSGFYINGEDAFLRYGFNFGAFLRIVYLEEMGVIIDPISAWGLKLLGFHLEVSGFKRVRFFYEHNILLYFTKKPESMKAALSGGSGSDDKTAGYIFGEDRNVLDFLDIKIGVRILL